MKGFRDIIRWMLSRKRQPWPKRVQQIRFPPPPKPAAGEIAVTFINHSTFLIQTPFANLLTDPIYSERASPFAFAGPKRVRQPGVRFDDLPRVDVVLLSHNHYDHMDTATLHRLEQRDSPLFVTALGNRKRQIRNGLRRVEERDWWERVSEIGNLTITLTPAEHFSARGLSDRNRTLWAGFFLEIGGYRLFFAGDSGYGGHFRQIRGRLGRPDLALLPIGAYLPRWFMQGIHADPLDAVQIHLDLEAAQSIAMHFGTFPLADEGFDQAEKDLQAALVKRGLPAEKFRVLEFGESQVFRITESMWR